MVCLFPNFRLTIPVSPSPIYCFLSPFFADRCIAKYTLQFPMLLSFPDSCPLGIWVVGSLDASPNNRVGLVHS
jgi:hypothetical protein